MTLDHLAFLFDLSDVPLWGLICLAGGSMVCILAWLGWLWANRPGHRTGAGEDNMNE
jgi:hypothetical protein